MTYAEMVKTCAQTARELDTAADDWRRLLQIEETLWPLAIELAGATAAASAHTRGTPALRRAGGDVRRLSSSLAWVHDHASDALETELRNRLDIALRSAMGVLYYLEQVQPVGSEVSPPQTQTV